MFQYDMLARSLASGNGFRWYAPPDLARLAPYLHFSLNAAALDPRGMLTTFRAPLYPAFLSVIYAINGINDGRFFAARLMQSVLGALLAPLTYFVARQISFLPNLRNPNVEDRPAAAGDRTARIGSLIVAAYPMLLIFPLALATENLFFVLVLASTLSLLKLAEATRNRDSPRALRIRTPIVFYSVLSGLLLGLAALTRSVILPFAGLAILWIWFSLKQGHAAAFAALTFALAIAPWIVRNSLVSHGLTGIETSMGYNLYVGYYPQSTGSFAFGPSLDLMSILDDRVRDQVGTQKALEFIREDPARFPYLALLRLGYFFNLELRAFTYFYVNNFLGYIPPPALLITLLVLALPFVIVALSASFGAALLEANSQTLLLALLFAGYLLPHVFILSEERFHLTLIPCFAILAANFWMRGISLLRLRGIIFLCIAVLVALLLLANWGLELARDGHVLMQMLGQNGNRLYRPY